MDILNEMTVREWGEINTKTRESISIALKRIEDARHLITFLSTVQEKRLGNDITKEVYARIQNRLHGAVIAMDAAFEHDTIWGEAWRDWNADA